ncbi:hypothetical protein [Tomitella cavernea]|nr:hypothetical protein [Tomitella cavernea]
MTPPRAHGTLTTVDRRPQSFEPVARDGGSRLVFTPVIDDLPGGAR